jgi:serine/threonine-protein kinase
VIVFGMRLVVWILGGHHVPAFREEMQMMVIALGASVVEGVLAWCFYIALEPHARKLFPRLLVSWTRLLRGRVRDPLVGRDVLYGVGLGTLVILFWGQLYVLIPHTFGFGNPPPPVPHGIGVLPYTIFAHPPPTRAILGGRYVLEALSAEVLIAFGYVLSMAVTLLGLRIVLRNSWAAGAAWLAALTVLGWPSDFANFQPIGLACSFAGAVVMLWAFRVGLLSSLIQWLCLGVWLSLPVTAKLDAPHFGIGLVGVFALAALAAYGALTTVRPRLTTS